MPRRCASPSAVDRRRRAGARRPRRSAPASRSASVSPTQTIGTRPCASAGAGLLGDERVALAVQRAPLGMADDDVAAAELGEHRRRDLAGERAADRGSSNPARPRRSALPCSSGGDLARGTAPARRPRHLGAPSGADFSSASSSAALAATAAVHLPVADDQRASRRSPGRSPRAAPACRCAGSIPSARARAPPRRPGRPRGSPA